MNFHRIRVRMPKWQAIRSANWAKELLMTFAGATLSIILTFGTAHILDEKQQREDGRQTAMMVIHDMENSAKAMRDYAEEEEKNFNIAQRLLLHPTEIDSLDIDTLFLFVNYITTSSGEGKYTFDDSSERIFLSSPEAWKNIDNPSFIDAVQGFFHDRRVIYSTLKSDPFFINPVSHNVFYETVLGESEYHTQQVALTAAYAKRCVQKKEVKVFIDYSYARRRYFNQFEELFSSAADKCKFMMGITDEELAEYVRNKTRVGKPMTDKKLVGTWKVQSLAELSMEREYKRDHTFEYTNVSHMSYSLYTGQVEFIYHIRGTWEIEGDSLITIIQPGYEYEIDRSKIHYSPEQEQQINDLLEFWKQSIEESVAQLKKEGERRKAAFASIDKTGDKMELCDEEEVTYLIRFDKP